jgi:diguanylate cyclase (GGDEF)-like protein
MTSDLSKRLPSPQGVALAIMQACQNEGKAVADIAQLVQADPALTGRLLQLANSAATGARPVLSALEAVNRMGLQTVQQLALGFSLIEQFQHGECTGFDYGGFWSHSLLMAVVAQKLGSPLRLGAADELFSLGLLSRIGCLALATVYPDQYTAILGNPSGDAQLLAQERAALATDHLEMSATLHANWGMPAVLSEAARHHEAPQTAALDPDSRIAKLALLLHLAWCLANCLTKQPTVQAKGLATLVPLAEQLGLTDGELEPHVALIRQRWLALSSQFKIRITVPQRVLATAPTQDLAATHASKVSGPIRVLLVDDDAVMRDLLRTWLQDETGVQLVTANDGHEALETVTEFKPHVILTDWNMPVMDGRAFCQVLRASSWGQNIYILMITVNTDDEHISQAFEAGVDAFLPKPPHRSSLLARFQAARRFVALRQAWEAKSEQLGRAHDDLTIANRRLAHSALTDPLTALANRRAGQAALAQAWAASVRRGQAMSVISVDVDHFKQVNDQHGHAGGDLVLQKVGQCLQASARVEDKVCRWGGEEFLLVCPNMTLREALLAAERLRQNVAQTPCKLGDITQHVTVSIGVATWRADMMHYEQLLAESDRALYNAKNAGRNTVGVAKQ